MNAIEHQACYGGMFPDQAGMGEERRASGKVFTLVTESPAGLCRVWPRLEVDMAAWDECVHCPAFEHCYKLSMARVAIQSLAAQM